MLGCIVSENGVEPDPEKIKCILKARQPQSKKTLRSILTFCSFNRTFMRGVSHITAPLHERTTQESDFVWNEDAKIFFYALKASMRKTSILAFPDVNKTFFVHTDASKYALGAVFMQKNDERKLVAVQNAIRSLAKSDRRYSTIDKEAAAVVFALKNFVIIFLEVRPSCILTIKCCKRRLRKSSFMVGSQDNWTL